MIKQYKQIIFYFLLASTLGILKGNAQENDFIPRITPPYPAAADLGKYGNIPVGMHTGSPNVNLEIYTLKEGGISIPISAGYSSNGVPVESVAKQLGLEWNLLVGGVVTRQVNDENDLNHTFYTPTSSPADFCSINSVEGPAIGNSAMGYDSQKDIFNYSALGISGKFFMDGTIFREINPSGNKIEFLMLPGMDGVQKRMFKITDTKGNEYFFGGDNAMDHSTSVNHCGTSTPAGSYDTAWHLSKIKLITGQVVTLKYIKDTFRYNHNNQLSVAIFNHDISTGIPIVSPPCHTTEHHNAAFVSEIQVNDKKITFEYAQLLVGAEESLQLMKIKVYTTATTLHKTFDFEYFPIGTNKRIYLKGITEVAPSGQSFAKYSFDYYNKEALPLRTSYAKDIYGYYNAANNSNLIYNNLSKHHFLYSIFKNIGSNRKVNTAVVHYGMLKSITYPTKGKTELYYEPNQFYTPKIVYPDPVLVSTGAEASTSAGSISSYHFTLPFTQNVTLTGGAELLYTGQGICKEGSYPTHWNPFVTVSLINVETNVTLGTLNSQTHQSLLLNAPAGTYKLTVTSIRPCLQTWGSITYFEQQPYTIHVNDPVAGVRVQKTLDYDNNGSVNTKKYYYGSLDCLDCSSGEFTTIYPEGPANVDLYQHLTETSLSLKRYTMTSSTKVPLYGNGGTVFTYPTVIEGFGENFENGGIVHTYQNSREDEAIPNCAEYIRGTPTSNAFGGGNKLKSVTFKKIGNIIKNVSAEEFKYTHDIAKDYTFTNYTGAVLIYFSGMSYSYSTYNVNSYDVKSQWHYLSEQKSVIYTDDNELTNFTHYYYDNPVHLQPTRIETTNSKGEQLMTKTRYPDDIVDSAYLGGDPSTPSEMAAFNRLKTGALHRTSEPIQIESYVNGILSGVKKTVYRDWGANFVLPEKIMTIKGTLEFSFTPRVTYNQYDSNGNPVELQLEEGMNVVYIWGYGKTMPIAKIENATYIQVAAALGTDISSLLDFNEANLPAINGLRTSLPEAMVTTFTYIPLVGIQTVTDPKGDTMTYEYDAFSRLKSVKDHLGNILSSNDYNYRPN